MQKRAGTAAGSLFFTFVPLFPGKDHIVDILFQAFRIFHAFTSCHALLLLYAWKGEKCVCLCPVGISGQEISLLVIDLFAVGQQAVFII